MMSEIVADTCLGNRGHKMADKTKQAKKSKTAAKPALKTPTASAAKPASKGKTKANAKVDPITLSVIRGIHETTQREMTLSLEKTARSSVFNLASCRLLLVDNAPLRGALACVDRGNHRRFLAFSERFAAARFFAASSRLGASSLSIARVTCPRSA